MFRLLVVEDQVDFYENYLVRIFSQLLPMQEISLVHAPDLQAGLAALAEDSWDLVLMDFALGPKLNFQGQPVRDGTDLVAFRRAVEERSRGARPRALIWGMAANQVSNRLLFDAGADGYWGKEAVVEMAQELGRVLKNHAAKEREAATKPQAREPLDKLDPDLDG